MKKLISIVLCAAMSAAAFTSVSAASGEAVVGELTCERIQIGGVSTGFGGNTLKADITYSGGASAETSVFRWLYSDSADGEYIAMPSEKSAEYVVSPEMLGKFVKLEVTPQDGSAASSNPIEITSIGPWGEYAPGISENTPDENVFTIDGQEFILLDYTASRSSKFFVMAKGSYGKSLFNSNEAAAGNQRFDVNTENTLAYMLNHEFKESGYTDSDGTYKLPDKILESIDYNHAWVTEMGQPTAGYTSDTVQNYGISVLSASEAVKYKDKYGYKDGIFAQGTGYWLRTPMGAKIATAYNNRVLSQSMWVAGKFGGVDMVTDPTRKSCIRPVFYLDRSFFLTAGDSVTSKGSNVIKAITDVYTPEELGEIMTPEVGTLVSDKGQTGFGGSVVSAPDSNVENFGYGELSYSWLYSDSEDGEYKKIISESEKTYKVSPEVRGKYIKLEIAASDGKTWSSEPLFIDSIGPKGEQAAISGNTAVTPAENVFTIGEKQFILLDYTDNENSTFFILAKDSYGAKQFNWNNISDRNQYFDVNAENTLANFLNNDFKALGNDGAKLPDEILSHIDYNHAWVTEMGQPTAGYTSDTSQNYGISVLSVSEALKYAGRYGYKDDDFGQGEYNAYWLRSPLGYASKEAYKNRVLAQSAWSIGKIGAVDLVSGSNTEMKLNIRPAFYLGRSFFPDEIKNISDMGANVVSALKKIYTNDELSKMGIHEYDISVKNASAVQDGENSVISFTVESGSENNKNGKLIVALYNAGRLAAVKFNDYTVIPGEKSEEAVFENAPYFDSYQIMIWNSNLSPMCAASQNNLTETPHLLWGVSENNIFTSDSAVCTAKISFPLENTEAYSLTVTVDGVEKSYPFFGSGGVLQAEVDFGELTFAAHTVNAAIKRGSYVMLSEEKEVNLISQPESGGFNAFGICASYSSASLNDFELLKQMKLMGYTNLRMDFTWNKIEKEKGVYDFSKYDELVNKADEYGIDIMALIDYNNNLYSGSTDDRTGITDEENRKAYADFAAAVAARYGSITRFEIWNEPNGVSFWKPEVSSSDYSMLCSLTAEKIREKNPEAQIYAGSLDISKNPIDFLSDMFENGLYESIDGITYHPYFHPYGTERYYEQKIEPFRSLINEYGGFKKLSANELDWLVTDNSELSYQAAEVVKAAVILNANDITEGNYLNFRNYEYSAGGSYGMENPDKSKRPLFFAAAQLNTILKHSKFVCKMSDGDNSGYLFTNGKENTLIAWGSGELSYNHTSAADIYGNSIFSEKISLSDTPVYIYGVEIGDVTAAAAKAINNTEAKAYISDGDFESAVTALESAGEDIISNPELDAKEKSTALYELYLDLKTAAMCAAADCRLLQSDAGDTLTNGGYYAKAVGKYAGNLLLDSRKTDGSLSSALGRMSSILYKWAAEMN